MNRKERRRREKLAARAARAPDRGSARAALGTALEHQRAGRLEPAEAIYRRVLQVAPESVDALHLLGVIEHHKGRHHEAAELIGRALDKAPKQALIHNSLGIVLRSLGRLDQAMASFERALALDGALAEAHNNLGRALRSQGRLDEAVAAFRHALAIDGGQVEILNNLGNTLQSQGRHDEADACFRRVLASAPEHIPTLYNLALSHRHGPGDPAIAKLEDLLERDTAPGDQRDQLLFALGKAYDDLGDHPRAFDYYRRANAERRQSVTFDARHHRALVAEIERAFPAPHPGADAPVPRGACVPIFVVGLSRSGKSLVEAVLARHPAVCAGGERLELAAAIRQALESEGLADSFPRYMDGLSEARIREIGQHYVDSVSRVSPDSRFFVNTLPEHVWYLGLILRAMPGVRVIACERDPLDNCLFVYFKRYEAEHGYAYDLADAASHCADYRDMVAHWRALYGERILVVAYEELVRERAATAARLYAHCGLEGAPDLAPETLSADEIGYWCRYEPYLEPLRRALAERAIARPTVSRS